MTDLSVIIPARNEEFLGNTIDDVLSHCQADTKVIVIIDGYQPDPPISERPGLRMVKHNQSIGQRAAVNEGVRLSDAKYIMKLDAHCSVDEGFDIKLMADCRPDWTVIPRMYNLHAFDWKCRKCGKQTYQGPLPTSCEKCGGIEFDKVVVWQRRKSRRTDFWRFDKDLKFQYWHDYSNRKTAKTDIADTMSSIGACFFMERQRYLDIDGLDEAHGSWGQMGTEIACKSWLSGGRQVSNKKTWFAHMFRTNNNGFSFPYPISGNDVSKARNYSKRLWLGNIWPKAVHDMDWLIDKFAPVPDWHDEKTKQSDCPVLSVIIPARNEKFLQATIDDIIKNFVTDYEIIVGLDAYDPDPPLKKDPRVRIYRSDKRVGMRPLINHMAGMARGKYLMKTDGHCSFDEGYDRKLITYCGRGITVLGVRYLLDTETWQRRERTNCDFRYLSNPAVDNKGGLRGLPWHEYAEVTKGQQVAESMSLSGSGWLMEKAQFDWWGGLDAENYGTMYQEGAEIACKTWLSGGKLLINRNTWYAHHNRGKSPYALSSSHRQKSIDYSIEQWMGNRWPLQKYSFDWLLDKFRPPGWDVPVHKTIRAKSQGTLCKGIRKISVAELYDKRMGISEPAKRYRLEIFFKAYGEFLATRDVSDKSRYYNYLISHRSKSVRYEVDKKDRVRTLKKMQRGLNLCDDIEKNGLLAPLEFYQKDGNIILFRGYRRLAILKHLGVEFAAARVHINEKTAKYVAAPFTLQSGTINELGARQFAELGGEATDKYYVHNYLQIYDRYFEPLRNRRIKLLEFGILKGASVRVWHEAFKKAQIYGADKNETIWQKYTGGLDRFTALVGNQRDPHFIERRVKTCGKFDIIIDDASHNPSDQSALINALWPSLNAGGFYVVEDTYKSYLERHRNGPNVPQELAGRVNQIYTDHGLAAIHLYYNLCIIQKGI